MQLCSESPLSEMYVTVVMRSPLLYQFNSAAQYLHKEQAKRLCFVQVYMPNGSASAADCTDPNSSPLCPGVGSEPYVSSVSEPLNYGAKVQYDAEKQMPYFTAMVIEWLDRWKSAFEDAKKHS